MFKTYGIIWIKKKKKIFLYDKKWKPASLCAVITWVIMPCLKRNITFVCDIQTDGHVGD